MEKAALTEMFQYGWQADMRKEQQMAAENLHRQQRS
jgi:hypothetical protein